jgi:DNA topoisomerase-1
MQDALRVLAGDCTVTYEDDADARTVRGRVVTLVKPDGTVLVHDAGGYRPAAWLTRADTVAVNRNGDAFTVTAGSGATRLRVESHETFGRVRLPVSVAGSPVGECPDCDAVLVRDGDTLACTGCRREYRVPRDATVTGEQCSECGLPTVRVERGAAVTVCADRECDPLAAAVADRFDGAWPCPDCGTGLEIRRERGLRAVCPDCERRLAIPRGEVVATCDCGLPVVGDGDAARCLDPDCGAPAP